MALQVNYLIRSFHVLLKDNYSFLKQIENRFTQPIK